MGHGLGALALFALIAFAFGENTARAFARAVVVIGAVLVFALVAIVIFGDI